MRDLPERLRRNPETLLQNAKAVPAQKSKLNVPKQIPIAGTEIQNKPQKRILALNRNRNRFTQKQTVQRFDRKIRRFLRVSAVARPRKRCSRFAFPSWQQQLRAADRNRFARKEQPL
jgi:hypothetical protein